MQTYSIETNNRLSQWANKAFIVAVTLLFICTATSQGCSSQLDTDQLSVTIAAVGDTNGYNILQSGQHIGDPLQEVRGLLQEQDIFIFNCEGVLLSKDTPSDMCHNYPQQSMFYSPPQIADFLHPTHTTIATLANNHILDCSECGIQDTIQELTSREILTIGAGENSKSACQPISLQVNGINLVFVSYLAIEPDVFSADTDQAGAASWEACSGEQQLAELAATEDMVVASLHLHLGQGWTDQTPPEHIDMVQGVLDAGADIIIAHGPHVPQGIMVSEGRVALLSLGNFLFRPDYVMPEEAHQSIMAKITILPDIFHITLIPLVLDNAGRPRIPPSEEANRILGNIADLSAEFGTTVKIHKQTGYITVHRQPI